ncbi:LLM class F420-dependent oxidoreductase [Ktedonosporobacter rubrisoli]|uniref:LLM class F420-dependent oxidoreductase n=2 Tax=Ktedonosporobacter rubrisoli TaxID=2509675 RepID=A0A4P6K5W3_KTERU|nr:LLM class F420-dependent oxidoreductase [Ktedonosporobacter rubrisoli]
MDQTTSNDPVQMYETMTAIAQTADEYGYESVWLFDHFHPSPILPQDIIFEAWTATAALARDTKRVRIGQLVTCNNYRNPALLAKMASTVDVLSHGRLNFGIGCGWREDEYRAYGYEYSDAPTRLRQLREAIQVILAMWTQDEAQFEGNYYQVRGAINHPKGVQKPHIPLLVAGDGEKVTLKLVARYANACSFGGDFATIAHKLAVLKKHCEAVGRDYQSIHRTVSTICAIGSTEEQAMAKVPELWQARMRSGDARGLVGTLDTIRELIAAYEAAGVQELQLTFMKEDGLTDIQRFAKAFIG